MEQFVLQPIGVFKMEGENVCIALEERYASALAELDAFSHIQVLWWFSHCDNPQDRSRLEESAPYKGAPATLGTFATRSPARPNPIALSCAGITFIDHKHAIIGLTHIDAEDGTPVLDLKPYTPSLDRVETPLVPSWCRHWPGSLEESAVFDWESQFYF